MRGQPLKRELQQLGLERVGGEIEQSEVLEFAGDDGVRPLILGQGLHVAQRLSFSLGEIGARELHLDKGGAGDQCVDVPLTTRGGTPSTLLVERRAGGGDVEKSQYVSDDRLGLAALISLSIALLRDKRLCTRADIGQ